MQYSNMSSCQAIVSGTTPLPDFYKTQLQQIQPSNTPNQFVGNQGMQFNNAAMPVSFVPMLQPSVGLNSPLPDSSGMTISPLPTPPNPTHFQIPISMPVGFPNTFVPQVTPAYYQPNFIPQFCFPDSNACSPSVPHVPAPAGYVANVTPMQIDDSGQSPGLQPFALQAQNPDCNNDTPVQVYAIPNYAQPGTYYLQTQQQVMVDNAQTDVNSKPATVSPPSRSVDSEDPRLALLKNQVNAATIQNFGNLGMKFVSAEQLEQSLQRQTQQNNFNVQMNSLPQHQQQNVGIQLPIPQQQAPVMTQNNYMATSCTNTDSHRDNSRSKMNHSPPGFLDMNRVQNVARENLNQHSNNFENQAQIYNSRSSNVVRRSHNGLHGSRDRKRTNDYGRRSRNNPINQPVPMVNAARQNKRPRKENKKGGNKTTKRKTKRYGYRTKQDKIENVYARVTEYFSEMGVLVPEDHGVRGETVARVHIKKWLSLVKIEEAIARISEDRRIKTVRVSAPVSMKNQYQKKGFLIYWETETIEGLNHLMAHFKSYDEKDEDGSWKMDEFQKISVALQNDATKTPITTPMETETSPSTENLVSKASLASLNTCFAKPNTSKPEAKVPFMSIFTGVKKTPFAAANFIPLKKPTIADLEKLAFEDEEDAFGEDALGFTEKVAPPMIEKFASNCSICSIGA